MGVDGDTKNSTFALTYKKEFPDRFVECFIAEQNLVGVAIGMGCRQRNIVFVSTFAAFFTRAFDQIRMGAISQSQVNFVGSHAGCSIGEDVYLVCVPFTMGGCGLLAVGGCGLLAVGGWGLFAVGGCILFVVSGCGLLAVGGCGLLAVGGCEVYPLVKCIP